MDRYALELKDKPFKDYNEYMEYVFDCVNTGIDGYISKMKEVYAAGDGSYKNVMYPDIEVASDLTRSKIEKFNSSGDGEDGEEEEGFSSDEDEEEDDGEGFDDELLSLLGNFGSSESSNDEGKEEKKSFHVTDVPLRERIDIIGKRAELTIAEGISLPFYDLCRKLKFEPFTIFCFCLRYSFLHPDGLCGCFPDNK